MSASPSARIILNVVAVMLVVSTGLGTYRHAVASGGSVGRLQTVDASAHLESAASGVQSGPGLAGAALTVTPTATLTPTARATATPGVTSTKPAPDATLTSTIAATSTVRPAPTSPIRKGSGLPERPATRLVIPAMNLDVPVVLAPIVSATWQVDHLGTDKVGHLEGTASPGDPSNVVLAAHVTTAHRVYGPFAGMGRLQPGDEIIVYSGDLAFTYVVDYRKLVERTDVDVVYPTETGRVTLLTCNKWSDEHQSYQQRLAVVGQLVTPLPTPHSAPADSDPGAASTQ